MYMNIESVSLFNLVFDSAISFAVDSGEEEHLDYL
jgi:hypothetical protein